MDSIYAFSITFFTFITTMKNYYQILGIPTYASPSQISAAYKARLAEWKRTDNQDTSRYMDIEEAWENLGDDLRRKWYDDRFLDKIQQKDTLEQASIKRNYDKVKAEATEGKPSSGFNKKLIAGGLSGGALYFIMHAVISIYHLAPHSDNNVFNKESHLSTFDEERIRHTLDSLNKKNVADTFHYKPEQDTLK